MYMITDLVGFTIIYGRWKSFANGLSCLLSPRKNVRLLQAFTSVARTFLDNMKKKLTSAHASRSNEMTLSGGIRESNAR